MNEERYAQAFKRFQDAARRTYPPYDRKNSTAGWGHVYEEAERRAAAWTALAEAARAMHELEPEDT